VEDDLAPYIIGALFSGVSYQALFATGNRRPWVFWFAIGGGASVSILISVVQIIRDGSLTHRDSETILSTLFTVAFWSAVLSAGGLFGIVGLVSLIGRLWNRLKDLKRKNGQ
jgi:hypothetical protein